MYKLFEIQFIYAMHVYFTYYKELKIFHFAKYLITPISATL